ncbi:MAG TPA: hypothetical protein VNK04_25695 [Gemmataceae bacterium]|nr:hypothetical protein [Gemmataceae bacterium]
MARYLALDWDHQQLHLVAANVSSGAVRIQRAVVWHEAQSPNPAEAAALGRQLRERLKEAGIAAAPVLACVGRDRVILRDIRHPAVPAHEEPAVVRFQAIKELTEPPDEVVIDYTPAGEVQGERRALTLIARRELLAAYQELCQAAGLKLAALTPRPFGIVTCQRRLAAEPAPADGAVAVLAVAERWAEFCVTRGETVLFARALAVGPTLLGEVRRNLAVYAGQWPQHPVQAVYVAGGDEHAAFRENLQHTLGVPVHSFDPLAGAERLDLPDGARGAFAGAVGLLWAQASKTGQPINFVQPKQPRPPQDPNRRRALVAALVVVLIVGGLVAFGHTRLSAKGRQVAEQHLRLSELERRERELTPDVKAYDALKEWSGSNVNLLDDLYELTALFPDTRGVQLKELSVVPQTRTAKDKDNFVARITLKGTTTFDKKAEVQNFHSELFRDPYFRPTPPTFTTSRRGQQEFEMKVEAKQRPPSEYKREVQVPPENQPNQRPEKGKGRFFKGRPAGEGME